MITYVFEHQEAIAATSLTSNTSNNFFKVDLAIFRK